MTETNKQLLIDYASGRPLQLMARDLRCHENTLMKRVRAALAEIDMITDYRRAGEVGNETLAAFWKIKFMQRLSTQARKRIRATNRWSKIRMTGTHGTPGTVGTHGT